MSEEAAGAEATPEDVNPYYIAQPPFDLTTGYLLAISRVAGVALERGIWP
jgi:hypothetical protein